LKRWTIDGSSEEKGKLTGRRPEKYFQSLRRGSEKRYKDKMSFGGSKEGDPKGSNKDPTRNEKGEKF